ncbi:hypothetical protein [Arenibacter sp. F20364]|uniref:hypothetical protein n=1 Tax=Arenibacter sp. F20364 TaxID=2926415 RepID=UPI001FF3DD3C|nr:hypothetical protein [Arenibacter sp. F20364]MCK0192971.1 hypothetical protein [Arenibacter sp. F20364]
MLVFKKHLGMDKIQYEKLKLDYILQTFADKELFDQWLRNFFYLNSELRKEYDAIYQNSFYIVFYELVTVGLDYSKSVLGNLKNSQNMEKNDFYKELISGLKDIKSEFSESEFEFIEYKRHSSSHIFQTGYQKKILNNGTIKTKRKEKLLDVLNSQFYKILIKHGFDRGFDEYMNSKLYPKIMGLHERLEKIKTHYNKDECNGNETF